MSIAAKLQKIRDTKQAIKDTVNNSETGFEIEDASSFASYVDTIEEIGEYVKNFNNLLEGIATEIYNDKVTVLSDNSFKDKNIISASFPNVTDVGDFCFNNSTVTDVDLPSVEELKDSGKDYNSGGIFANCKSLKNVNLSNLKKNNSKALFSGCSNLERIFLSNLEETNGDNMFAYCYNLNDIDLRGLKIVKNPESMFTGVKCRLFLDNLTTIILDKGSGCNMLNNYGYHDFTANELTDIQVLNNISIYNSLFGAYSGVVDYMQFNKLRNITYSCFGNCNSLKILHLPSVVKISLKSSDSESGDGRSPFSSCNALEFLDLSSLPILDRLVLQISSKYENGSNIYYSNLKILKLNSCRDMDYGALGNQYALEELILGVNRLTCGVMMYSCRNLKKLDLINCTSLLGNSSDFCLNGLDTLILRSPEMCVLEEIFTSSGTPIEVRNIYVPRSLIEDYKIAVNWVTYADKFKAIEDYPNI